MMLPVTVTEPLYLAIADLPQVPEAVFPVIVQFVRTAAGSPELARYTAAPPYYQKNGQDENLILFL